MAIIAVAGFGAFAGAGTTGATAGIIAAATAAAAIGAELVQTLGKTLLFWKRNPQAARVDLPKASGKKAKKGAPAEAPRAGGSGGEARGGGALGGPPLVQVARGEVVAMTGRALRLVEPFTALRLRIDWPVADHQLGRRPRGEQPAVDGADELGAEQIRQVRRHGRKAAAVHAQDDAERRHKQDDALDAVEMIRQRLLHCLVGGGRRGDVPLADVVERDEIRQR